MKPNCLKCLHIALIVINSHLLCHYFKCRYFTLLVKKFTTSERHAYKQVYDQERFIQRLRICQMKTTMASVNKFRECYFIGSESLVLSQALQERWLWNQSKSRRQGIYRFQAGAVMGYTGTEARSSHDLQRTVAATPPAGKIIGYGRIR